MKNIENFSDFIDTYDKGLKRASSFPYVNKLYFALYLSWIFKRFVKNLISFLTFCNIHVFKDFNFLKLNLLSAIYIISIHSPQSLLVIVFPSTNDEDCGGMDAESLLLKSFSSMNSTWVNGKCPFLLLSSPSHWPLMLVFVTLIISPTSNFKAVLS